MSYTERAWAIRYGWFGWGHHWGYGRYGLFESWWIGVVELRRYGGF